MEKTRKKNMVMTNEDIVRSYKEAKDRRAQIKVLAELNVCPQELIIEILKEGGVDWRELPRQRKKQMWRHLPRSLVERCLQLRQAAHRKVWRKRRQPTRWSP